LESQDKRILDFFAKSAKAFLFFATFINLFLLFYSFYIQQIFYSILFIATLISLIVIAKKEDEVKINFSLSIFIFGFMLLLTELFLEFYPKISPPKTRFEKIRDSNIPYDERSKYQVINDFKKIGEEFYPTISPSTFIHSDKFIINSRHVTPLGGLMNEKHVFGNENGKWVTFKSDEHGFNNPAGSWEENIDVLIIGDSFSMGAYVDSEDNIASLLRKSGLKVVSLGYSSNGPLIEYSLLKEYSSFLKPKKVLWFYFEGNDLADLRNEIKSKKLIKYLNDDNYSQGLMKINNKINENLKNYIDNELLEYKKRNTVENSNFNFIKSIKLTNIRIKIKFLTKLPISTFEKILSKSNDYILNSLNSKLFFVYLPAYDRYSKENTYPWPGMKYREDILSLAKSLEIETIDIHNLVFEKVSNPKSLFPFELPGHYNSEGYKIIADTIKARISKF